MCKRVLQTRDMPSNKTLAALREDVRLLYEHEDIHGIKLKDIFGFSLHHHLVKHGMVQLLPQYDDSIAYPTTGWVPAGEGIPLSIDIVRKYYSQIGEQLSGTFVLKPLKNGWARIKNRTVLNNFRFHPGDGLTYCFYSMDVPASMKNIEYRCFVRFTTILIAALREEQIADPFQDPVVPDIISANELAALEAPIDVSAAATLPASHLSALPVVAEKSERLITGIDKVGCGKECVAGLLGFCVHGACVLIGAAQVISIFVIT